MKRLFIRLSVFIVITSLIYYLAIVLLGLYAPGYFKPNITYKKGAYGHFYSRIQELKTTRNPDILFLGSSHTYRGFDTRIFRKAGLNTFNLGSSSQTPLQTSILLKRYLKQINPKLIIFEVNPLMFSSDGLESALDLIANDENDLSSAAMALHLNNPKTYNTLIYAKSREFLGLNSAFNEPARRENDTYIPGGYVQKDLIYYTKPEKQKAQNIELLDDQLHYFEDCLTEIKKNNIQLILLFAPITKSLYSSYSNPGYFDQKMKSYGKPYYNFNQLMNLTDSAHFYDSHHLNQHGVELFNNKVIEVLKLRP